MLEKCWRGIMKTFVFCCLEEKLTRGKPHALRILDKDHSGTRVSDK